MHNPTSDLSSTANTKMSGDMVRLNVGGRQFTASLLSLRKFPDSMLAVMFSGKFNTLVDENGYYLIDRDGDLFVHILKYLREDCLPLNDYSLEIYKEAQYFGLSSLVRELEQKSFKVIANSRREQFRMYIASKDEDWQLLSSDPDIITYQHLLNSPPGSRTAYDKLICTIIKLASLQMFSFEKSQIVLTDKACPRLDGVIEQSRSTK